MKNKIITVLAVSPSPLCTQRLMLVRGVFVAAVITFFLSCTPQKQPASAVLSITLNTLEHGQFSFSQLQDNKASAIIFLQPECPFCNSYGKTLAALDSAFSRRQVQIYGVVAGKFYPDSEIIDYREKYHLHFPFLLDPEFQLCKALNAKITPQVFLVDAGGHTRYHGMIDNWGYEIGKARAHATEFYLTAAVNNFLAGKPISPDSTKAVGCYIQ